MLVGVEVYSYISPVRVRDMIRIEDLKEGMLLRLNGKTKKGNNRVTQHGTDWKIKAIGTPHGGDTLRIESLKANFIWQGMPFEDVRVVKINNDPNFDIEILTKL